MKRLFLAGIGLLALGVVAISQVIGVPTLTQSHPFTDLIQVIPNGAPAAGNAYTPWAGVTNVYGYYKDGTATGNQTLTFGTNVTFLSIQNASAINTLYLYTATAPFDGARNCVFSIGGVTNVTMYASTGQTLNNAITTLAANTNVCYLYSASNTTWDRD